MMRLQEFYKRRYSMVFLSLLLFLFCAKPAEEPEVYFSPEGGALKAIESQIEKAEKEIDLAMYAFTSDRLAQGLIEAKDRGIKVYVILDSKFAENEFSKDEFLAENDINLRLTIKDRGVMHNKFCIIDSKILITGSYNWTKSAEDKNDENILIFPDAPRLTKKHKKRFDELWSKAKSMGEIPKPVSLLATDLDGLRKNAGTQAIIKGKVCRIYHSRKSDTYFLDFGPKRGDFTCVIFRSVAKQFRKRKIDPLSFDKKWVEMRGKIKDDPKYGLEILLQSPNEIKILKQE